MDDYALLAIRNRRDLRAYYEAPSDSYLYTFELSNPITDIQKPVFESTSIKGDTLPYWSTPNSPSPSPSPSIPIDIPNISREKIAFSNIGLDEVAALAEVKHLYLKSVQMQLLELLKYNYLNQIYLMNGVLFNYTNNTTQIATCFATPTWIEMVY